jgi:hypothetical protein
MVQIRPLNQQHIGVEGSNISASLESGSRLDGAIGDAALRMARSEGSAGDRLELTGGDSALSSGGSGTKGSGGDLVLEMGKLSSTSGSVFATSASASGASGGVAIASGDSQSNEADHVRIYDGQGATGGTNVMVLSHEGGEGERGGPFEFQSAHGGSESGRSGDGLSKQAGDVSVQGGSAATATGAIAVGSALRPGGGRGGVSVSSADGDTSGRVEIQTGEFTGRAGDLSRKADGRKQQSSNASIEADGANVDSGRTKVDGLDGVSITAPGAVGPGVVSLRGAVVTLDAGSLALEGESVTKNEAAVRGSRVVAEGTLSVEGMALVSSTEGFDPHPYHDPHLYPDTHPSPLNPSRRGDNFVRATPSGENDCPCRSDCTARLLE